MPNRRPRIHRDLAPIVLGIGCLLAGSTPLLASEPDSIPWRPSFEQALRESEAKALPLWIQFSGPWCGYCRLMESTTFFDPQVVSMAGREFVPVQVRSDLRDDLVSLFGIRGVPCSIVLNPVGQVVARSDGYSDPSNFAAFLRAARARSSTAPKPSAPPALGGYCPVRLVVEGRLVPGDPEQTARHDGQLFRFSDSQARKEFLQAPERFVPRNAGRCVVHLLDENTAKAGDPRFGVYYQGRLYLCADAEARRRFARDPERYANADLAERGYCLHCRKETGRLVRGLPEYETTVRGRRYRFPDPSHRDAFLASPESYLR